MKMREIVLQCVRHATVTTQECAQQFIPVASLLFSLEQQKAPLHNILQFVVPVFILFGLEVHLSSSNCSRPCP